MLLALLACNGHRIDLSGSTADTATSNAWQGTPGDPAPHVDSVDNDCADGSCTWWVKVSGDPASGIALDLVDATDPSAIATEHDDAFVVAARSGEEITWA